MSEQSTLFDLSVFSRPEKTSLGDWGWENEAETPEPEIRRFQVGDRIQAKLPNSPEGIIVEIRQGKYPWSDRLLVEWDKNVPRKDKGFRGSVIASKATLLAESYPTEVGDRTEDLTGKTESVPPEGDRTPSLEDFLSYPTEQVIDEGISSGKTMGLSEEGDPTPSLEEDFLSYPTELGDRTEDLTGKTIREQIMPLSISEKRSLLIWLQETIKDEEWTPPPVKSGRQVVGEPVRTSNGYRRQELVRCGKATCKTCPHGPYWYEYWSEGGKRRSKYLGKNP
ncbi:hypothetical protein [Laspinema olomoucense]|uniref:hypothetical protein n=1 Tax=Laspinema olomoucense TaxID=3231600 RepID=UPI0021BAB228|nr:MULTISPECIES: hypothetical protein [unclassified Laspinema]MCT7971096.1 hypothetical protein [Laspinema sp. D3d]MCT7987624.1 hypothetical protein [Laspinema sp. D3a]